METKIEINLISQIDEVLSVAKEVFNPKPEDIKKYHNKSDWLEKIKNEGLLVTTAVKGNIGNKIVGYAVCYKKEDVFHIWHVGVLKEYRQLGVWKQIYDEIMRYAKDRGYSKVTVNTHKKEFSHMYDFLVKQGFIELRVENGKSFFQKII